MTHIDTLRTVYYDIHLVNPDPLVICFAISVVLVIVLFVSATRTKLWGVAIVFLIYLVLVNISAWSIRYRSNLRVYRQGHVVTYVATRKLKQNTLLLESYLRVPASLPPGLFWFLPSEKDLVGKYVIKQIESGGDIDPRLLTSSPTTLEAARVYPVPDGLELSKLIDAGAIVQWCTDGGECLPGKGIVEAIVCNDNARTYCILLLDVDDTTAKQITSKHKVKFFSLQ
jgi:hypothetical protein